MTILLPSEEIHIWLVDSNRIECQKILTQYHALLDVDEIERNKRFMFEKDRKQHLITRALIRSVLTKYIDKIEPDKWRFEKNHYGKPFIVNKDLPFKLEFNVSHTEGMIVLAVSNSHSIGIDVESLDRDVATESLANYSFSAKEFKALMRLKNDSFKERFFSLWTLKESYIKARGMGLSLPLGLFSFTFKKNNKITISFENKLNDSAKKWQIRQIKPNEKFIVSCAVNTVLKNLQFKCKKIVPLGTDSKCECLIILSNGPD